MSYEVIERPDPDEAEYRAWQEKQAALLACPWCGEFPDIHKHFRDPLWQLLHRCKIMGALHIDWTDKPETLVKRWNHRHVSAAPADGATWHKHGAPFDEPLSMDEGDVAARLNQEPKR